MNHAVRAVAMLLFFLKAALVPDSVAQQSSSGDMSGLVKSSIDAVVLIVVNDATGKPVLEGSGFLVSSDGRIVTNHHVIASASSAIVKLNNGAFFPVEGIIAILNMIWRSLRCRERIFLALASKTRCLTAS